MDFPFKSTKTFHQAFPVAYRQWKADSHCRLVHGYALTIHLEFGCFDLDARNWCVDFGSLRPLKSQLEEWFDHATLVAQDDPHREYLTNMHDMKIAKITVVERTGCEGIADFIFEHLNDGWLKSEGYADRVICTKVEVRETDANMAMRCLSKTDYLRFTANNLYSVKVPDELQVEFGSEGSAFIRNDRRILCGSVQCLMPGYKASYSDTVYLLQRDAIEAELAG